MAARVCCVKRIQFGDALNRIGLNWLTNIIEIIKFIAKAGLKELYYKL